MSRQAFLRVEATANGMDAWVGVSLHALPGNLLGWLEIEMAAGDVGDPYPLALLLEMKIKERWPGAAYFVETGWHKAPKTYQIYADGI